ncbi:MAG: rolling circle replication-associated protein [Acidimicrobiales bacterium]
MWNAVPWDELDRLTMITLTYPSEWRAWCPDGPMLKRHLRAFRERWRRKWGAPRGVWVLEFQPRAHRPVHQQFAPHFHLYVELPEAAELWDDASNGGTIWDWARQAWWEILKSGDANHRRRGVHLRPCFYGRYGDGRENAKRVGDYLWRESGKLEQKAPPEGFEGVKWWDVWGMEPVEVESRVDVTEFVKMRRVLRRKRDEVAGVKVRIRDQSGKLVPRRRELTLDGVTVTNLTDGFAFSERLVDWAESETGRDRATDQGSA